MSFNLAAQTFDIKSELIMRKLLENNTDWDIEFNENYENPYDYDLQYYRHVKDDSSCGYKKELIGYIEVERYSRNDWVCGDLPAKWYEVSFLKRKIFKYNHVGASWTNEPKDNHDLTIYLKVNNDYTDCFCTPVETLVLFGEESKRSDGSYNDSFVILPRDSVYLTIGIDECIRMIKGFHNSG